MFKSQKSLLSCQPPKWAKASHVQTIVGYLLPSAHPRKFDEKLQIEATGGDKLISYYHKGSKKISVYLFHGLCGRADSSYMRRTCGIALGLGAHVYSTNHRGCGESLGLAREPYHSGRSDDLARVIAVGRARNPDHIHLGIGFSLSGNAILLLAAGVGAEAGAMPDSIISVNAPINLEKTAQNLGRGLNKIYDQKFANELRFDVKKRMQNKLTSRAYRFPIFMSAHQFDEIYTGEAAGFGTRKNYYKTCSAAQFLEAIKIPTLILTSEDDPFVEVADFKAAKKSKFVDLQIQPTGGHLGYLSGETLPFGGKRWLDYFLYEQIKAVLAEGARIGSD